MTVGVQAASVLPGGVTMLPSRCTWVHPHAVVLMLGDERAAADHTGSVSAFQVGGRHAVGKLQTST